MREMWSEMFLGLDCCPERREWYAKFDGGLKSFEVGSGGCGIDAAGGSFGFVGEITQAYDLFSLGLVEVMALGTRGSGKYTTCCSRWKAAQDPRINLSSWCECLRAMSQFRHNQHATSQFGQSISMRGIRLLPVV